jgi:putative IMPACT (imprinted ancient) family translation regulator
MRKQRSPAAINAAATLCPARATIGVSLKMNCTVSDIAFPNGSAGVRIVAAMRLFLRG